jgi:hypothetical protein
MTAFGLLIFIVWFFMWMYSADGDSQTYTLVRYATFVIGLGLIAYSVYKGVWKGPLTYELECASDKVLGSGANGGSPFVEGGCGCVSGGCGCSGGSASGGCPTCGGLGLGDLAAKMAKAKEFVNKSKEKLTSAKDQIVEAKSQALELNTLIGQLCPVLPPGPAQESCTRATEKVAAMNAKIENVWNSVAPLLDAVQQMGL